jgi:protein involved in polysaccharide export with SLBB domain
VSVKAIGEVRKPGAYEILPGETVEDLVRLSGGFATTADRRHLLLERTDPGKEIITVVFDADSSMNIELQDMDIIVIPDLASLLGMEPVEVIGGGGRGGAFQIKESEKLKDFLLRLWRFTYQYDLESAVIERWEDDDKPLYIYFNVREVLEGDPLGETALKAGDTVSFPAREAQVFVTGEVVQPGAFPFQPGFTAERYIALAGGPNERGTYNRVDIFGSEGASRSGDRHTLVYRGETIVVKTKTSRTLAGLFWGATSLTGLILAIYAVTQ